MLLTAVNLHHDRHGDYLQVWNLSVVFRFCPPLQAQVESLDGSLAGSNVVNLHQ